MTIRRAIRRIIRSLFLCAISALLLSCGSGGIGSVASLSPGGTSGTGVSMGQVSSFGSVLVNGVRYRITIETDFSGPFAGFTESDLAPGMWVQVNWNSSDEAADPVADKITYRPELIGPVTAAYSPASSAGPASISIAGRTVIITPTTLIDDPYGRGNAQVPMIHSAAELQDGERVEVSGTLVVTDPDSGTSRIEALRIARLAPLQATAVSVTGVVADARPGTFEMRDSANPNLTVTFSADVVSNTDLCQTNSCEELRNGRDIRVSGFFTNPSMIEAENIEVPLEQLVPLEDPAAETIEADLDGQVTDVLSGEQRFRIAGQWVGYDGSTVFSPENAVLEPGQQVRVTGILSDNGAETILLAEVIQVRPPADIRLEDHIASLDQAVDGNLLLTTRIGLKIRISPATILREDDDDDDDDDEDRLQLDELAVDDSIAVRGFFNPERELVAVILERDDDNDDADGCELVARVSGSQWNDTANARYYSFAGRPGLVVAFPGDDPLTAQIDADQLGEFDGTAVECGSRPAGIDFTGNPIDAGFFAEDIEPVFGGDDDDD